MLRINKEKFEIYDSDVLNFDQHVQPILDRMTEDLKEAEDDLLPEHKPGRDRFYAYELTDEDKLSILRVIILEYEWALSKGDYNTSIFDEDGIEYAIKDWGEERFGFIWD